MKFVYLGLGTLGAAFLRTSDICTYTHKKTEKSGIQVFNCNFTFVFVEVACWMITGERQAARIRNMYLKTILRQDIGFFDVETNTGEVVGRMSGDTVLIQDAMGEKVKHIIFFNIYTTIFFFSNGS